MPIYPKTTRELLIRKLQEIDEELEALAPGLLREKRAIETVLDTLGAGVKPVYEGMTPWLAISHALDSHGDFTMTKKELLEEMIRGGYKAKNPKAARGLLNDSLNFHLRKKVLTLKEELIGRARVPVKKAEVHG